VALDKLVPLPSVELQLENDKSNARSLMCMCHNDNILDKLADHGFY